MTLRLFLAEGLLLTNDRIVWMRGLSVQFFLKDPAGDYELTLY